MSLAVSVTITLGYAIAAPVHLSPLTPLAFLERSAAVFPHTIAVTDGERQLTWAELRERSRRLAVALQEAGIEKGDRVAYLALNTTELLEAHFGVPAAGGVLVAVNTRLLADEVEYILGHAGARILVVDPSLAPLVDEARVERVLVIGESYEAFLAGAPDGEPENRLEIGGRHDLDQLHERHDRPAEGRHVHAPRRLHERARGGAPRAARLAVGLPLDAADVPLQRLVLHVGRHGHRCHGTCACRRSIRRSSGG